MSPKRVLHLPFWSHWGSLVGYIFGFGAVAVVLFGLHQNGSQINAEQYARIHETTRLALVAKTLAKENAALGVRTCKAENDTRLAVISLVLQSLRVNPPQTAAERRAADQFVKFSRHQLKPQDCHVPPR